MRRVLCCAVGKSSIKLLHCVKVLNEPNLNSGIDHLTPMSLNKAKWDSAALTGTHGRVEALRRSESRFFSA